MTTFRHSGFSSRARRGNSQRGCCSVTRTRTVRNAVPDNISHEKKWQIANSLQKQLNDAVDREDYSAAARHRDEIKSLNVTPMQELEMQLVDKLRADNCTYDEKASSLRSLARLYPTEETEALILECIRDERLTNVAQQVIQAIWLRHPTNMKINTLMEEGCHAMGLQAPTAFEQAQAKFEEATQLDPTFAEAWNKVATILYMRQRYTESIQSCEQALALNPRQYLALSGKGMCYVHMGDEERARECWRAALAINPFLMVFRRYLNAMETGEYDL